MAFLDTNHDRAALLLFALGVALVIALTPYITGLVGIPVLYAVFATPHDWLARRRGPKLAAALVPALARLPPLGPGGPFSALVGRQAEGVSAPQLRGRHRATPR